MASTAQTEDYVSLKLLVDEKRNKVIFAEAGKDFVDVLFSFLTFPLGTIARLVEKKSNMEPVTVGCLNKLYQSVRDLDKECLRSDEINGMLLQPTNSSQHYCSSLKLNIDDTQPAKYFLCKKFNGCTSSRYMHISRNKKCGCDSNYYNLQVSLKHFHKGFVKDGTSFVITDNLVVMPNSVQFTSLGLLHTLGVNGATSVKELTVNVTKETVLDMLKCSMLSNNTLTHLFLRKQPSFNDYLCIPYLENKWNIEIKVKLVIRKSNGKVLYAQGEQHFADLLLSFLSFPLGAVLHVLGGDCSIGNIDSLYKSIDLVESEYFVSQVAKNRLVNPNLALLFKYRQFILPVDENPSVNYYYCYYQGKDYQESITFDRFFITDEYRSEFGGKYEKLEVESPRGYYEGYVMGPRAYMATDDLVLTPWSPISALHIINNLEIPLHDIKEKLVTIGFKECLSILKASLISTSALTNGLCHLLTEVKEEIV